MEKWRVTVQRYAVDPGMPDDPLEGGWEPEVELIATREQLARFAPGVVAEALGNNTVADVHVEPVRVPGQEEPAGAPDKPKRTRRTKAEMEAARAAEDAAKIAEQARAEKAVTNGGPDPYPADSPTHMATGPVVESGEAPAPAVPFNPFAPK